MKTMIVTMLLTLTAITASAQAILPHAAPVAKLQISGGFAPLQKSITILTSGEVLFSNSSFGEAPTFKTIATLAPDVLNQLKTLVQSTSAGSLLDPNPKTPACMDAPSETYYAVLADGTEIAVAGHYNCKDYVRKEYNSGDMQIKNVLEGLLALSNLL